jgi:uncharacterized Zn finger protein (UPF0148 family)
MDPICPICGAQNFEKIGKRHHQKPALASNRCKSNENETSSKSAEAVRKMDLIELPEDRSQVRFRFPPAPHSGKEVVTMRGAIEDIFIDSIAQLRRTLIEWGQQTPFFRRSLGPFEQLGLRSSLVFNILFYNFQRSTPA